jgi:hypothetical protein
MRAARYIYDHKADRCVINCADYDTDGMIIVLL